MTNIRERTVLHISPSCYSIP